MKKIIEEMENNLKNAQEGLEGIKICLNDKPDNDRLRFMLGRKIELEKKIREYKMLLRKIKQPLEILL